MYNPSSLNAEEFICHDEALASIAYASENRNNLGLVDSIIEKAERKKGLSHREASVLLACDVPEKVQKIYALAERIKQDIYGNRIVMFAPLYLSNYCINSCSYCPYHAKNKHIARKKLTQEDIVREVTALQDMGHKRLAIESGEDPLNNPIEYILESIRTIYSVKHGNGAIRRVNVNIAATTAENYRKLKDAGIGTYILFQETYHKQSYEKLHPAGPKHNYAYHTEAMDRAMQGGIDDVGIGVLFGLERYHYEFAALLMHAEHLEAVHGVGPHTISVPRVKRADDIDPDEFGNGIDDETFAKICACLRLAVPYTGMIISTRESKATREKVIRLGVSQISGASKTSVGGYGSPDSEEENSAQFDVSDNTGRGRLLADGARLHPELLYGLLPGGQDGRPIHGAVQKRQNCRLLPSQRADDFEGVSGGLRLRTGATYRFGAAPEGTGQHSEREDQAHRGRTSGENRGRTARFQVLAASSGGRQPCSRKIF